MIIKTYGVNVWGLTLSISDVGYSSRESRPFVFPVTQLSTAMIAKHAKCQMTTKWRRFSVSGYSNRTHFKSNEQLKWRLAYINNIKRSKRCYIYLSLSIKYQSSLFSQICASSILLFFCEEQITCKLMMLQTILYFFKFYHLWGKIPYWNRINRWMEKMESSFSVRHSDVYLNEAPKVLRRKQRDSKFQNKPSVVVGHVIVYFELTDRYRHNLLVVSKSRQAWTKMKRKKVIQMGKRWTFRKRLRSRISSFWSRSVEVHLARSILPGRNAMPAYMPLRFVFVCLFSFSSRQFLGSCWGLMFVCLSDWFCCFCSPPRSQGDEKSRHGWQEYDGADEGRKRRAGFEQKPLRGPPVLLTSDRF